MLSIRHILTPDLAWLLPLAVITFALEHVVLDSLARHYTWARLRKPETYTVGVTTLCVLFLAHALAVDALGVRPVEYLAGCVLIVAVSGATVRALWATASTPPVEIWPSDRHYPKANGSIAYNTVIALIENMAAYLAVILENTQESQQMAAMMQEYMAMIRENPQIDPDVPVQIARRILAAQVGKRQRE